VAVLVLVGAGLSISAARAQQPERDAEPPQEISIDRLLRLPDSYVAGGERRGGATRQQWRKRFDEARARVETLRLELARAQHELEGMAGTTGQWQAAAPGGGTPDHQTQTVSYKLRQAIREQRDALTGAERALRDLSVQADLADVPQAWRADAEVAPDATR